MRQTNENAKLIPFSCNLRDRKTKITIERFHRHMYFSRYLNAKVCAHRVEE